MKRGNFIYGIHPVEEAIRSGQTIDKVWVQEGTVSPALREVLGLLRDHKILWKQVPAERLNRMTNGNHQGIIAALSAVDFATIDQVVAMAYEKGEDPFLIVLDGVTDVRNFGAIVRSAYCAGAHGIVVAEKGGAAINADAVKTSAGALMHIPICRVQSLYHGLKFIKNSGLMLAGATEKATDSMYEATLAGPVALILGDEEKGLGTDTRKLCDVQFRIPMMKEGVGSLNVSVAAGVALYEVVRQRGLTS
ncbi:MAG: 23S rRNA (guanosine(2251)-2'-O)-methyltransferase RlmB [Bacteroidetes bacterium]|nr:23S rRNA (guanosine(2251)-2'-O)-methyltransferase RlmB [Bacteroidota bacterium]